MPKRLKGWRRIRKGEDLRPGQAVVTPSGLVLAHFVGWHPTDRRKAVIDAWGIPRDYLENSETHSITTYRNPTPGKIRRSVRVYTTAIDIRHLRVVA
jgi:hypothetical protein